MTTGRANNPQEQQSLQLSSPNMETFKLRGRPCKTYGTGGHVHAFYPPRTPDEWPQRVGDIGDSYMRRVLNCKECQREAKGRNCSLLFSVSNPILVLIHGKVYTNDIPFWLCLTRDERPLVVYSILSIPLSLKSGLICP